MEHRHLEQLRHFDERTLPGLDEAVLGALELFSRERVPELSLGMYKRPMVVGSGNAEAAGRIMFRSLDAVFASESDYEQKLKDIEEIDGVVLVSASGAKHAPIIAQCAREYGKHVTLITNTPGAPAEAHLDHAHQCDEYVFPKNREPYTYNTSTYMGMILGATGESPEAIHTFIAGTLDSLQLPDFARYDKFYLIVPPKFGGIIRMLHVKFIELFGRRIARDVETSEYAKHATTVVPSDELFISFGTENTTWGDPAHRFHVPLPEDGDYGAMMAVSYYIIGKIQKAHPPYFKDNIEAYVKKASEVFGHDVPVIVE